MAVVRQTIPVTRVEYEKGRSVFEAAAREGFDCLCVPPDEPSLAAAVTKHKARAVIVGVDPYRDALYEALPKGGIIARFGVGVDSVDRKRATERGILVANTPGVLSDTVAEYAVWLMGALARHVAKAHEDMRGKGWRARVGVELQGKKLALLGCGEIGRRVARIASGGLRMNVVGYDVADIPAAVLRQWGVTSFTKDLFEALSGARFVSLHIPSLPETRHFLNSRTLAAVPRNAFLVNTARGPIIDEAALYDALSSGALAGAALDVFENEPYVPVRPDKDLRTLENVLLTCHMASASEEACVRMAEQSLANVRAALAKRYGDCAVVNRDVLRKLAT
ncbi:MAG: NAD(P)-dependent oxidoreductase [Planctomycetota bacterium]